MSMADSNRPCAVVALGGNAISPPDKKVSVAEQFAHTRRSLSGLIQLLRNNYLMAIVHGNGPQVGAALRRVEIARDVLPVVPLGLLVAETQGSMGYMIEQSLQNLLEREKFDREVITFVTQVLVDRNDPALNNPTKPVGHSFTEEEAQLLINQEGWAMRQLTGKNLWRRVVYSPNPISIQNSSIIRRLVHEGKIVITAGGGGIPVYRDPKLGFEGIDAVIDKDFAAAILGKEIDADELIILTNIDAVRINYGQPDEKAIRKMTVAEAKQYNTEGHFSPGSMKPKVEAAVQFLEQGGKRAIVCELKEVDLAIQGQAGTIIVS